METIPPMCDENDHSFCPIIAVLFEAVRVSETLFSETVAQGAIESVDSTHFHLSNCAVFGEKLLRATLPAELFPGAVVPTFSERPLRLDCGSSVKKSDSPLRLESGLMHCTMRPSAIGAWEPPGGGHSRKGDLWRTAEIVGICCRGNMTFGEGRRISVLAAKQASLAANCLEANSKQAVAYSYRSASMGS
jgi:hypothetical protein